MTWRDISTAPKDGRGVLLTDEDGAVYGGYWETECLAWAVHCGQPCVRTPAPTHWAPLPEPPKGAEG